MPKYTDYKKLELPLSIERYNVEVFNKNYRTIDSELARLNTTQEQQEQKFATKKALEDHINDTDNPHNVTKEALGLDKVDNTADMDKPVSSATQRAISDMQNTMQVYTDQAIENFESEVPDYDQTMLILNGQNE